jgi:DNA-binding NarL/FixJ family response regulator
MPFMRNPLSLLLVDASQPYLDALRDLMVSQGSSVVGTARSAGEALALARERAPTLAIVDFATLGKDGHDTIRRLKELPSPPRVILLTTSETPAQIAAAIGAGAKGFIAKPHLGILPLLSLLELTGTADG